MPKANLKALFQRLSGADAVKIDEDGFNLNDLSQEEMVGIVDRIKIELASHGKKVYFAGEGLSTDEIEQVVGSTGMAEEISNQMSAAIFRQHRKMWKNLQARWIRFHRFPI